MNKSTIDIYLRQAELRELSPSVILGESDSSVFLGAPAAGPRVSTLRKWRHEGRGPQYVKQGSRIGYRIADLLAWEESSIRRSTVDPGPSSSQTAR